MLYILLLLLLLQPNTKTQLNKKDEDILTLKTIELITSFPGPKEPHSTPSGATDATPNPAKRKRTSIAPPPNPTTTHPTAPNHLLLTSTTTYTSRPLTAHTRRNNTMPQLRAAGALRAVKSLSATASPSLRLTARAFSQTSMKGFSQSTASRAADHADAHESHYDPPSGWLFGVKPGEKAEKEGWEGVWVYGFFGSLGLAVVGYAFKPDTS